MSCSTSLCVATSTGNSNRRKFMREALKAFRKFVLNGKVFYTCNVNRLKACNRLGSDKEVSLWKTHFFLHSPCFDDASGMVFSSRPGTELVDVTRGMQIDELHLSLSTTEMVEIRFGRRTVLDTPLIFASDDFL